jgi:hypothetical protein
MFLHMLPGVVTSLTTFTVADRNASVAVGAVKPGDAGQFMVAAAPGAVTHVGAVTS